MDQREAESVIEIFLKERSLTELYDAVLIPALSMVEEERHKGTIDEARENFIIQSINEFVAELADYSNRPVTTNEPEQDTSEVKPPAPPAARNQTLRVLCIPARDRADESTAVMLAQLLELAGCQSTSFPVLTPQSDVLETVSTQEWDTVCISALPPFALMNARSLSKRLRARFPKLRIVVGLWNFRAGGIKTEERLEAAFTVEVVTSLAQAVERLQEPVGSSPLQVTRLQDPGVIDRRPANN